MPALIVMGADSRPRKPCPGFVRPQPGLARLCPAPASSAAAFSRLDPARAARSFAGDFAVRLWDNGT